MKDKEYYIWKAKHQRGLSDDQINYFLDNYSRYDLLPHYSCFVKHGYSGEKALKEVKRMFDSGT